MYQNTTDNVVHNSDKELVASMTNADLVLTNYFQVLRNLCCPLFLVSPVSRVAQKKQFPFILRMDCMLK